MYPIVPFLDRRNNTRYKIPKTDTILDKETPVFISSLALHYSDEYWLEPKRFNPERFSPENEKLLTPFTYLPFGEGPRNCIGKLFFLLLLISYLLFPCFRNEIWTAGC